MLPKPLQPTFFALCENAHEGNPELGYFQTTVWLIPGTIVV